MSERSYTRTSDLSEYVRAKEKFKIVKVWVSKNNGSISDFIKYGVGEKLRKSHIEGDCYVKDNV